MDRTGIIVVAICAVLLGWWFVEQRKIDERQAEIRAQVEATNHLATAQAAVSNSTFTATASAPPSTPPEMAFDTNAPEQLLTVTNGRAVYTFTSRGGGLKQIKLLDYPETISPRWEKTAPAGKAFATLNTRAPLPVLAVTGDASLTGDGNFTLTKTGNVIRAEKDFADGLRLIKEFRPTSNYLVSASVRFENDSSRPLALPGQQVVVGTATPMDVDDTGFNVYGGAMWYNGASSTPISLSYFNPSTTFLFFFPRTPKTEYRAGNGNVVWAEAHNQYFTLLAMTATNQPAQAVVARPVPLSAWTNAELNLNPMLSRGVETALVYPAGTLAPKAALERNLVLYAGPKEYRTLADIGEQFHNRADLVMNFGRIWGFFAKALLLAMNWVHDVTRLGYGWVIVLITVFIKLVFWPLTAKSTRSMKKMQALQPEIAALKEKYKDDQQKLMQKQMELWKTHKVNPMSGCLPMLIQMPVFLGFFTMIRSAIELRGARFLWVKDLSKPDTLFMIPGLNFPFNLMPLLMGGAMLWQAHLTPPSPGVDPAQQKIMRYMPLIFLVFLYNYSSGLALYWTVNNMLTVIQTKMTRMNQPAALAGPTTNPALTPVSKRKK